MPKKPTDKQVAQAIIFQVFEENKDNFLAKMRVKAGNDIEGYYDKYVAPIQPKPKTEIDLTTMTYAEALARGILGNGNGDN